ncbi:MAG: hypothetical protein ABIF40_03810 [archaeon]
MDNLKNKNLLILIIVFLIITTMNSFFVYNQISAMATGEVSLTVVAAPTEEIGEAIEEEITGRGSGILNRVLLCQENWTCTHWANCDNDQEIRICHDRNKCETTKHKPIENKSCIVKGPLFDIKSNLIKNKISLSEILFINISLTNFGEPGTNNVTLNYSIIDLNDNVILTEKESKIIGNNLDFIKIITLPEDIDVGHYILYILLIYDGGKASTENIFEIIEQKEYNYLLLIILILILIQLLIIYFILKKIREK